MNNSKTTVSRPLVGFLAICLLMVSLFLLLWPGAISGAGGPSLGAATGRVGILMAALWLALPAGNRAAAWSNLSMTSAAPIVLVALALVRVPLRFLLPLAGIVLLAGFVLRPRPLRRPERRVD